MVNSEYLFEVEKKNNNGVCGFVNEQLFTDVEENIYLAFNFLQFRKLPEPVFTAVRGRDWVAG